MDAEVLNVGNIGKWLRSRQARMSVRMSNREFVVSAVRRGVRVDAKNADLDLALSELVDAGNAAWNTLPDA